MSSVWSEPVEIELAAIGSYQVVTDTQQAAEALLFKWPVTKGEALSAARRVCLMVLEGQEDPERARDAFLAAAQEADVSIRPWQRNLPQGRSVGTRWVKSRRAG